MRTLTIFAMGSLLLMMGCAAQADKWKKDRPKTVPASGTVTYDGKPLDGAQVVLVPTSGNHGASALSLADGSFRLTAFPPDDGVVPGSYKVMVVKSLVPEIQGSGEDSAVMSYAKLLIPEKYTDPNKSGLTVDIPDAGTSNIKFELQDSK